MPIVQSKHEPWGKTMLRIILGPSVCLLFGFLVGVATASEDVSTQSEDGQDLLLYLVEQKGGFGFINREGKVVIAGPFSNAMSFSEGFAAVRVGGKWGFVDATGQFAIEPRYDNAQRFSEALAAVRSGKKWGYIDRKGTMVIEPAFAHAKAFSEGLAVVWNADPRRDRKSRIGYIDKTGRFVVEPQYSGDPLHARNFSEGLAPVTLPDEWRRGYIDRQGRMVISPEFIFAGDFSEGLAAVATGHPFRPQNFYIDKTGKRVLFLDSTVEHARDFHEGLASVMYYGKDGGFFSMKMGCIDKRGRVVIDPVFSDIGPFSEGLAYVRKTRGGKWGYIDRTGKIVIEMKFDWAGSFSEGIAQVMIHNSYAYIDKTGKYIWPPASGAADRHLGSELER